MAEDAGAVGEGERHYDQVADLQGAYGGADGLDDTDRLVAHHAAGLAVLHCLVGPEVAAADAGARDAHDRIGRLDHGGIGDVLYVNVTGAVHDGCSHRHLPRAAAEPVGRALRRLDAVPGDLHFCLLVTPSHDRFVTRRWAAV